jgi:hypothetical protein
MRIACHRVPRTPERSRRPGIETPFKTPSGTDITSPATAKQLRNSDSGFEICVANLKADDSKLHPAIIIWPHESRVRS